MGRAAKISEYGQERIIRAGRHGIAHFMFRCPYRFGWTNVRCDRAAGSESRFQLEIKKDGQLAVHGREHHG